MSIRSTTILSSSYAEAMSMTGVDPPDEVILLAVPETDATADVADIAIQAVPLHAYMVANGVFQ